MLRETAVIIDENLREEDMLARYGGEEFVLLLPDVNRMNAFVVAEKIRSIIEQRNYIYKGRKIPVTVSIGIAEFHEKDNAAQLIERADKALYNAKNNGRNRSEACSED